MDLACGESALWGRFQVSGWICSEPVVARGWGQLLPVIKALVPVRAALVEIMTGFEVGQKTENRAIEARFWLFGLGQSDPSGDQTNCWSMKAVS
jgi:hypothetical protein